jgi:galactonate dehydratase
MKITDLKVYCVDADWRNWIFVKVFTDAGVTGVGEASLEGCDAMVEAALVKLRDYFIGKDPLTIEYHWNTLFNTRYWRGLVFLSAIGGVEMALWDILGKVTAQPVHALLGGAMRSSMRAYTHISEGNAGHSVEQQVEEASQAVAEGWTMLKWDPLPVQQHLALDPAALRAVVKQVEAVRQAVGDDVDLCIELHGRLDPNGAIQLARVLEQFRPYFLEEPVPPDSLDALQRVAETTKLPLATGERLLTTFQFWPLLEKQLVSYLQPDIIHVGGITPLRKIAALADARYIRMAPHNPNGPVAAAALLHFMAHVPNFGVYETAYDDYLWSAKWRDEFITNSHILHVDHGYIKAPDLPGLGIDLNEEAIKKYPPRSSAWGISHQTGAEGGS